MDCLSNCHLTFILLLLLLLLPHPNIHSTHILALSTPLYTAKPSFPHIVNCFMQVATTYSRRRMFTIIKPDAFFKSTSSMKVEWNNIKAKDIKCLYVWVLLLKYNFCYRLVSKSWQFQQTLNISWENIR